MYDSTLLVGLENMLVVVAFILVSQAALIDRRIIWAMCLAGGLLALCRFSALKRWMRQLNLPARLLTAGMALLVLNVALPIIFRSLHEHKVGTKPTWGPAYETNQVAWLLLLPALCAVLNWMPARRQTGELWLQRWWLPATFCALWITGTVVHLYCLGYVYDFDFRLELAAPAAWVLLWLIAGRAREFVPALKVEVNRALLTGPLAATLLAINENQATLFFSLTLLNAACYGAVWFRQKQHRLALHLSLISIAALVAGVPGSWLPAKLSGLSRPELIAIASVAYAMLCFALASNPKIGVLGGVVVGLATASILQTETWLHWGLQAAVVHPMARKKPELAIATPRQSARIRGAALVSCGRRLRMPRGWVCWLTVTAMRYAANANTYSAKANRPLLQGHRELDSAKVRRDGIRQFDRGD